MTTNSCLLQIVREIGFSLEILEEKEQKERTRSITDTRQRVNKSSQRYQIASK